MHKPLTTPKTLEDWAQQCRRWHDEGKSFGDMREELKRRNIPVGDVDLILRQADAIILDSVENPARKSGLLSQYGISLLWIAFGALITIYTYSRVEESGGMYIIAYGPVLYGTWLYMRTRRKWRNAHKKEGMFQGTIQSWKDRR